MPPPRGADRGGAGRRLARAAAAHRAQPALPGRARRRRVGAPTRAAIAQLEEAARERPGGPRPRLPARRCPQARGPLRGGGGALPAACSRPIPRTRSRGTTSRTSSSRAAATTRRARATRRARRPGAAAEIAATSYYNLSLAHLQKFEYQAYNEAQVERGPARPRAGGRLRPVEVRHRRLRGGGPRPDPRAGPGQVRRAASRGSRCGTSPRGRGHRRGAGALRGSLANRFVGVRRGLRARRLPRRALARAEGVHAPLRPVRRRPSAATATSGQASGGPLLAVLPPLRGAGRRLGPGAQPEDGRGAARRSGRRERVFRVLSVLSPGRGAGLRRLDVPRRGAARGLVRRSWRCSWRRGSCPSRRCSRRLSPPWLAWPWPGWCSLGVWLAANRFRPESDVALPARPAGPRRARVAQAAG